MPEFPEIFNLVSQFNIELKGKTISDIELLQPKCLNVSPNDFKQTIGGTIIGNSIQKGKWIFTKLLPDKYILLNLGMGGDVLYHNADSPLPDKYQAAFNFSDGSRLSIKFWWFGYLHVVNDNELSLHKMTSVLGQNPLTNPDFDFEKFNSLLNAKKGGIKSLLMDQKNIAGIGNVYIQDILFKSKLHPNRKIADISAEKRKLLYDTIIENLRYASDLGGLAYERDLYGNPGRFKDFLVGYKEGQPCPECGTVIEKIKTGSTATFICPNCQRL